MLVLSQTTAPEEILVCHKQTAGEWNSALPSLEHWLQREQVFATLPVVRGSGDDATGLAYWVVKDLALGDGPEAIVALCETLTREWLAWRDGVRTPVLGVTIGGVVVDKQHRGKGVAAFFMTELARHWDTVAPSGVSCLYSEVGEYYLRFGFRAAPMPLVVYTVGGSVASLPFRAVRYGQLELGQVLDTIKEHCPALVATTVLLAVPLYAMVPSPATHELFATRAAFIVTANSLSPGADKLPFGVVLYQGDTVVGGALLTYKLRDMPEAVQVLRAYAPSPEVLEALVSQAAGIAAELGLPFVEMWLLELVGGAEPAVVGGTLLVEVRSQLCLPMWRPHSGASDAVWLDNYQLAWF